MSPNRARLSNITRNVLNMHEALGAQAEHMHEALGAQAERIVKLEKQLEAVLTQHGTKKRKYTTIQDSSPEDSSTIQDSSPVDGAEAPVIYCPSDVQELIEEMFPQVADIFCFISDHEVESKRYHVEKKQRCDAKPPAQPTAADMLGHLADSL